MCIANPCHSERNLRTERTCHPAASREFWKSKFFVLRTMFAKMSFLILLLFTLPLLSFAQESSMFYLAPDYDFRKVPDSGGKPVTVRSQCNISYLTAKPSTFGPHGCWRSWRPGPAGTWGASWTSTKLLKLSAWTPPSGSSGGIPRWDNQVHVEESNLLLKFVPKLSQSCLKAVPKLSQSYKQVTCFSRWEAPLSRTTPTTWPSPRAATPSSTSPRFFKIKM